MKHGVEKEDIKKYPKYHDYQDNIILERETNISNLKLEIRKKDAEIEKLKKELYYLKNYTYNLKYKKNQKIYLFDSSVGVVLLFITIILLLCQYLQNLY